MENIEYVLPGEIEKRSFAIIGEELKERGIVLPPEQEPVTKRVIDPEGQQYQHGRCNFCKGVWSLRCRFQR